jgi:protein-S-isoprenylcysteine O-methyltransferase Ste14
MALWAFALYAFYLALTFGGRTLLQLRTTGSTGFKGIGGRPGSGEWIGGVLFAAAILLGFFAPLLGLAGAMQPFAVLDRAVGHALGFVLFFVGLAGTLLAQVAMGASWRIGVDEAEKTDLVTAGPFAWVRNLIFSAMILAFLGLALLVPNVAALVGFAALVVAIEVQVRLVEEPYLLRTHRARYADYASRVERFVPGVGRLGPDRVVR